MFGRKYSFSAMKLVITCEHAGNEIPKKFQFLFEGKEKILNSHRGYDLGAFDIFQHLKSLTDFSEFQTISRLLIEMNRSLWKADLFSEFSDILSLQEKRYLLETYYFPYREKMEHKIEELIQKKEKVFHLSVHSFTPKLNGEIRTVDIGLLYDPTRNQEKTVCKMMKTQLKRAFPNLKIRMNYPYLGTADGFTTTLRKKFPENYMGIELEINQKFSTDNQMDISLKSGIFKVLESVVANDFP